jgi:hypothetical protein
VRDHDRRPAGSHVSDPDEKRDGRADGDRHPEHEVKSASDRGECVVLADLIHRVTQKTALLVFFAAEGLDEP